MEIMQRQIENVYILELIGRFDVYEVPMLSKWLEDHPKAKHVVVNLKEVTFVDSSGLSVLVKGLKRCRQNGGELYLSEMQSPVQIIFELTRLDKAFKMFKTTDEAVAAFTS